VSVLIEARGIHLSRGERHVLRGVDLTVDAGEAVALVGPNAVGKSTLLRTLAGLLPVTSGQVLVSGRPLRSWARDALARTIAVVASEEEGPALLTVRERVMLGRYPHRGPFRKMGTDDEEAAALALEQCGITALTERRLGTLSAGERQLAALARGLAQEPRVLLLDEPGAHLDVGHQLDLFHVLDEVCARGVAVVAVVHDLQRAAAWARRMVLLADGLVASDGTPPQVLASEACARAFQVAIRGHAVPGVPHPLYTFDPRGAAPRTTGETPGSSGE
jgi:ABC-type cobalamin/Fe3+-siderophores transport system ATPase subunit